MKLEHHLAASTIISVVLYAIFKSWGLTISSFVTGIFIDLDHVIDYFGEHGLRFNTKDFFLFFYAEKHRKITMIFHGWELLVILVVIAKLTNWEPWVTGVLIGYGQHMIFDYFYSRTTFATYSLLWKWKNKFNSEVLYPRNRKK